jgi:allophanate hydrolase subunit 1
MSDQHVMIPQGTLLSLVSDVASLKEAEKNAAKSREITRQQTEKITDAMQAQAKVLAEIDRKLDVVPSMNERLQEVEQTTKRLHDSKNKLLGAASTIGLFSGSAGTAIAAWWAGIFKVGG